MGSKAKPHLIIRIHLKVLEQERIITLSAKAAKTVFDLMENPPAPKERLKLAMRRREAFLCRK